MGHPRPTSSAPGLPRVVTPPPAVPPPAPSLDPVMSTLAQMMSKLNDVSDRLDRVEGAKAQCSNASTEKRKGNRVEFINQLSSQPLANPRNVGQASLSAARTRLRRRMTNLLPRLVWRRTPMMRRHPMRRVGQSLISRFTNL